MRLRRADFWFRFAPLAAAAVWCVVALRSMEGVNLCGFRWLTGRLCPLCGLTHALPALACGNWREALALNALSPLAATLLAATPLLSLAPAFERRAWQFTAAAFAAFGVMRLM